MLFSGLALAVRSGNYKVAGYLIAACNKKGGMYGFNQLHEDVFFIKKKKKNSLILIA